MAESQQPTRPILPGDVHAPLIGRERHLRVLSAALEQVISQGVTRIVTVLGARGTGKTRLFDEFAADVVRSVTRAPRLRVHAASAKRQSQGYGVFSRLFRRRFEIPDGAPHDAARERVQDVVARTLDDRKVGDVCYFLGQLMELSFPESALTRAVLDDSAQASVIRRAIVRNFLESDAARGPLCLILDDIHAADEDSLELLTYLLTNLTGPILLLCSARPELLSRFPGWGELGQANHERIELGPLTENEAAELMNALLAPCEEAPPEPLVEAAISMASGNPGSLEQMVRIFFDTGALEPIPSSDGKPRWKTNIEKLASARLPLTVEDAVAARVANLAPADRRVLEHAAAVGSVFWLSALVSLGRLNSESPEFWRVSHVQDIGNIKSILDDLVRRDYVLEVPDSAFVDDVEYVFKHTLEREKLAALTSGTQARAYHQVIADWLSLKDHVRSQEEYAAMLAEQLAKAGSTTRAGRAYLDAGDIARRAFAAKKAHEYYVRGLELLGTSDAVRRIDALHNHGDVLLMLGRTDEALAAFREMQCVAYRLMLRAKGGAAHNRIGRLYREIGQFAAAREHLDTALELFEVVSDERGIAASHDDIGKLLWARGEYDAALDQLLTALEMRKRIGDRRSIALSLNNIGLVWMDHGRARKAREAFEAALAIRREIGDTIGMAESLANLAALAQDQNDWSGALDLFREARRAAQDVGERNRIATILTSIGETLYHLGKTEEAIAVLTEAEELCDEAGDKLHLAEAQRGLAKAYLLQGNLRRARESIKRAVDLFGMLRSRVHLAVALRTLGEVTAAGAWGEGHEGKAVDYFTRSIGICKELGHELELARSYQAFSEYVAGSRHYRDNPEIQREAAKLGAMAKAIFDQRRLTARVDEDSVPGGAPRGA